MLSTKKVILVLSILVLSTAVLALTTSGKFNNTVEKVVQFTGKEDHSITLDDASVLTRNFQSENPVDQSIGAFMGREALLSILKQEGCVGVRIYYGLDEANDRKMVVVGVDTYGKDMTDGLLAERTRPCPPFCDESSELNTQMRSKNLTTNF
ncbi:MAG: hypothetical protein ACE5HO_18310 [bacterium]